MELGGKIIGTFFGTLFYFIIFMSKSSKLVCVTNVLSKQETSSFGIKFIEARERDRKEGLTEHLSHKQAIRKLFLKHLLFPPHQKII